MKSGNWIALDKNICHFLPHGRAYTVLEAMYSYTLDVDNNREQSINGYSRQWTWSRCKVRRFMTDLKTGARHLTDRDKTGKRHHISLKINNLQEPKDRDKTGARQSLDRGLDTTIKPNPKPNKKEKKVGKGKSTEAPESFTPTNSLLEFFDKESYWKENQQDLIDACLDNFRSKGEKKIDWEATIRNWCRNDKKWNPKNYDSTSDDYVTMTGLNGEDVKLYNPEEISAHKLLLSEAASKPKD